MTLRSHLGPRTPESAALHDELDRLLAARAVALEEAAGKAETAREVFSESCDHTKQAIEYLEQLIRALATTDSTEALDRVIRAHVEKALKMAARRYRLGSKMYDHPHGSPLGWPYSSDADHAIRALTADDVLREMGGRGNG